MLSLAVLNKIQLFFMFASFLVKKIMRMNFEKLHIFFCQITLCGVFKLFKICRCYFQHLSSFLSLVEKEVVSCWIQPDCPAWLEWLEFKNRSLLAHFVFICLTENFVDIFRSISSFSVLFFGIPKTSLLIKEMPSVAYKIEPKISQIGKKNLALESMVFCAA